MVTRAWVPKDWDKNFKSYQLRGNEQVKRSSLAGANTSRTAQAQRERHERRMQRDREWWEALDE